MDIPKNITIRTNHHWRNFLYGYELTDKEREELDFLDWSDDGDAQTQEFIRYRGNIIYPEFERIPVFTGERMFPEPWQGYMSDSYFSGLLIRYSEDCEQYQIATYIS